VFCSIVSVLVHIILFVCPCEVCYHIQLRTWILRYCIFLGRVLFFSHILLPSLLCSVQSGVRRNEMIEMVDIFWRVFQLTKGVLTFYGKGTHLLLWAGSRAALVKITRARPSKLLWMTPAGCRSTPLSKLHVKPTPRYITAVTSPTNYECSLCGCVITFAARMCRETACECRKFPTVTVPASLSA
jgi:hypothetical protein